MELKRKSINRDCVYNQTCRLSHDIHVISNFFLTFGWLIFNDTSTLASNSLRVGKCGLKTFICIVTKLFGKLTKIKNHLTIYIIKFC